MSKEDEKEMREGFENVMKLLSDALGMKSGEEVVNIKDYSPTEAIKLVKELLDKNIPFVPMPILDEDDGTFLLKSARKRTTVREFADSMNGDEDVPCNCPVCKAEREAGGEGNFINKVMDLDSEPTKH